MARLALELLLATAARRGDVVNLGPQHIEDGTITFEQHKKDGAEDAPVDIPLILTFARHSRPCRPQMLSV